MSTLEEEPMLPMPFILSLEDDKVVAADNPDTEIAAGEEEGAREKSPEAVVDENAHDKSSEGEKEEEFLGLLEQPVIIEGKRRRTPVSHFVIGTPASTRPSYTPGIGTPLSEESHFSSVILKHTAEELKPLHKLLFGHPGKVATIKRDLKKFNGFSFAKYSVEYEKRHKMFLNLKANQYAIIQNAFREFYWAPNNKDKEDYATRLLDILMNPPKIDGNGDLKTPKRASKTPVSRKRQPTGSKQPNAKRSKKSEKNKIKDKSYDESPNSEELKAACSDLIKDANLNQLTTKQVIDAVALVYPEMDVEKRRDEIKDIVKDLVMNLIEPSESS